MGPPRASGWPHHQWKQRSLTVLCPSFLRYESQLHFCDCASGRGSRPEKRGSPRQADARRTMKLGLSQRYVRASVLSRRSPPKTKIPPIARCGSQVKVVCVNNGANRSRGEVPKGRTLVRRIRQSFFDCVPHGGASKHSLPSRCDPRQSVEGVFVLFWGRVAVGPGADVPLR